MDRTNKTGFMKKSPDKAFDCKKLIVLMGFLFLIIFSIIMAASFISALPPLPTEFYGHVRDYNMNASAGELIRAYDSSGTLCGSFAIVNEGRYGVLTCTGDDPETPEDEGATPGENISFRYKGNPTTLMGNHTFEYGEYKYVNITYPVAYCGDNFCDSWYEDYYRCPQDCPQYNESMNISINDTNQTWEGGDGGAGTGGESDQGADTSGADSGGSLGMAPQYAMNFTGMEMGGIETGYECQEEWVCSNWSKCKIDNTQNRTCKDLNNCGTFEEKPPEVQKCVYTPTCDDGVMNGLEEGIDCGGLCPPCITCYDGIQNCHDGACELGIDCGGPCPPCPSCFDGKKNCHDGACEQGIDCGGPCEKKCPGVQIALPEFKCEKDFNPLSNQSIYFFIFILLVILANIIYSQKKLRDIKHNKKLKDIERAKGIASINRRMYLFIAIVVLVSIILYLYYYFFVMCEVHYSYLWVLLILLFVSPFLIHQLIRFLEFTEKKRLRKIENMLDTHYKQIQTLVRLENEQLAELEQDIADSLYRLLEKPEYKELPEEEFKLLKEIYRELIELYTRYRERKNPIEKEGILCNDVYELLENKKYAEMIKKDANIKAIATKLKLVYKQYEEKQKLYDELDNIEESKQELGKEEKEDEASEDSAEKADENKESGSDDSDADEQENKEDA